MRLQSLDHGLQQSEVYRHDTHMTRGLSTRCAISKKGGAEEVSKSVQNTSPGMKFSASIGTALRRRGVCCCATAIHVDACTDSYARRQRRIDRSRPGMGVAHPPGFPLWVMLAHLASLLPFGNIAARINFSSALFAALACAMLTLVVAELLITGFLFCQAERNEQGCSAEQKT